VIAVARDSSPRVHGGDASAAAGALWCGWAPAG